VASELAGVHGPADSWALLYHSEAIHNPAVGEKIRTVKSGVQGSRAKSKWIRRDENRIFRPPAKLEEDLCRIIFFHSSL
jgi:hypothetical protein